MSSCTDDMRNVIMQPGSYGTRYHTAVTTSVL